MSIKYDGEYYETLSQLGRVFNIRNETLRHMMTRSKNDEEIFNNNLKDFIIKRDINNRLYGTIKTKYGKDINTRKELYEFFKEQKIKRKPPMGCQVHLWYMAIVYAMENEYLWLVSNLKHFDYRGITYPTYSKFVFHYKIITKTLIEELVKSNGDLHKAILRCENDPEFGVVEEVRINGNVYSSLNEAREALGVSPLRLRQLRREGMTYQEAYEVALKNKEKFSAVVLVEFPITNGGVIFNSITELSEYLGYAETTTRKLICGITDVDEIFKIPKKTRTVYLFDGKEFSSIIEISDYLGVGHTTLHDTASKFGLTTEKFIHDSEKYVVYYENKKCYTLSELSKLIDLHIVEIARVYNRSLEIDDINVRSEMFTKEIKEKLILKDKVV